ncbi:MAG: tRNA pseudouridine(38-40) synthase TruA [Alphaproteobacteria bacterium]
MTRWKLTIEYKGSTYAGWQRQTKDPSVQQAIEGAIKAFCGQDITIHAAGRSDAGVHACGQVAHFDLDYGERSLTGYELMKALNAHLRGQGTCILKAETAANDFHARFSATSKLYRYRIINRSAFPAIEDGLAWHIKQDMDISAMQAGAKNLVGSHDFTTFRDSECQAKSPEKTLSRLDVSVKNYDGAGGHEITIETEGRSFLHHQVRNMAGTLSLVGLGKWSPSDVKTALQAKDRTKGGPTAPAEGLYLVRVDYA